MIHLFICREYPPAAYPSGGIGTYVRYMTDLLAMAGDTVHVIAHRWDGAPLVREDLHDGRLIVHRVALDDPTPGEASAELVPRALLRSSFPSQAFAWQAALLAERLVVSDGIEVIEAQEWEAPLYFFQLRRALGLGPVQQPPCVVHLHSPTERIFDANRWDTAIADYAPAVALEAFSIVAADLVLSPSRFLAQQSIDRYGIPASRVRVIPYPLGDVPHLDRTSHSWSAGSVCHVGRLEPRKGVFEWVDAVATVAPDAPAFTMEFIGGDMPQQPTGGAMVGAELRSRVPAHLRSRLLFRGQHTRPEVFAMLANAWAVVVPSRWDNLPYTCIEAMCTGLPVIASPHGGMRELVEDGVSGWIASDATAAGLAAALRRALATPAAVREQMGGAAERAVRRICDNESIVHQHREVKRHLCASARASHWSFNWDAALAGDTAAAVSTAEVPTTDARHEIRIVRNTADTSTADEVVAVERMLLEQPSLLAVAIADIGVELEPDALARCQAVFTAHPRVGVVSGWIRETASSDTMQVAPRPQAPHLDARGELMPLVVVRAQAYAAALHATTQRPTITRRHRDVIAAMLLAGWQAAGYPAVLARMPVAAPVTPVPQPRYSLTALAVQRAHTPLLEWLRSCPPEERRALLRGALANPARALRALAARATGRRGRRAADA